MSAPTTTGAARRPLTVRAHGFVLLLATGLPLCAQAEAEGRAAPIEPAIRNQTAALARELAEAVVPAVDDPGATCVRLLERALAAGRSPVAALLVDEAHQRLAFVSDLAAVQTLVEARADKEPLHGLVLRELQPLRQDLQVRLAAAPVVDPYAEDASTVLAIGPFGDSGRHFLDVPFAPDVRFPAAGESLPGRFAMVSVRRLVREPYQSGFVLSQPASHTEGCTYVQWRVLAAAAVDGYLEVDYRGSFRVDVDGVELGRNDPYLAPTPRTVRLPVHLPAGAHAFVVKTGDDSSSPLSLRLCDAAGAPLANVVEAGADAPAAAEPGRKGDLGPFRDATTVLLLAADENAIDAETASLLRAVAAYDAMRRGDAFASLQLLQRLESNPPQDPTTRLLLADLWQRATDVPEESRTQKARALESEAQKQLPATHHKAVLARVKKLEDQDQREQALRLLQAEIDQGRAGPATFATASAVLRALRFESEVPRLLRSWRSRCPTDSRPLLMLAERLASLGDPRAALVLLDEARALRPHDEDLLARTVVTALDLGDVDGAERRLAAADRIPAVGTEAILRLGLRLAIAECREDTDGIRNLNEALARHPFAEPRTHAQSADKWIARGDDAEARSAVARSLALDPDQPVLRRCLERLGGEQAEGADFARFRRDGDAAIAAFRPGEEERAASTTMLIDQRIVEVLPDGSTLVEVHELRAINDLQGVDALRTADAPARADELLLLRTVGKDGRTYVPTRVEGSFSMPRLEPGAFVEWRYRDRYRAPGADAFEVESFLFASQGEALKTTEWIVIQPKGGRGELRLRNLDVVVQTVPLDGDRTATVIERKDVPRIAQESSQPPAERLIPMAGLGEDESPWPDLRSTRHGLLWRTRTTPPVTDFASELLQAIEGDQQKLERAWSYCQTEIADGEAGDATEVLLRKKGNRFLLCTALLRAAGLDVQFGACEAALPILQGDGEPLFADGDRFRMPCAIVRPANGPAQWLFYDAPRHWPLGAVPAYRSGAIAFAIAATHAEQMRLPVVDEAVQDLEISGTCTVDDEGTRLAGRIRLPGFTGFNIAEQLRRVPADRQKVVARQFAQQFLTGWRMRNAAFVDLVPAGKPLALDVEVSGPKAQQDGESGWLLPLPLVRLSLREKFGDRETRTLPLSIPTDMRTRHRIRIEPPADRAFLELPPPLLVSFGPLDYQLTFARDGAAVVVDRHMRMRPAELPAAMYGDWIRWLSAIDRAEEQRLRLGSRAADK